jgi:dihydropyrimidine dehydrogenase (NAD+) subunit PreA
MDRKDMGSNIGKDEELISVVTEVVKEVARVPVWAKLTPSTTDIVVEARGAFSAAPTRSSRPTRSHRSQPIDPETLEFEMNVDGLVSSGGLGGPAILPLSMAKMAQLTQAFPDQGVLGDRRCGGLQPTRSTTSCSGAAPVQVCTAAMLDHAIGPNVIKALTSGHARNDGAAGAGRRSRISGAFRRDRVVTHSKIRRPDAKDYHGGYDAEGLCCRRSGAER